MSEVAFFWITFGVIIGIMILTFVIQSNFKKHNLKYSTIANSYNKTGAEIAREILHKNNINNVQVVMASNEGTDHYNPRTNVINLSPSVYNSKSISASAIASHEAGHAIQWGKRELGIRVRDSLAAPVGVATQFANILFMFGFFALLFGGVVATFYLTIAGVIFFGASAIFQFVTLPVEFGASRKAQKELSELGYLNTEVEIEGTKKLLRSAAMTYVIAFLMSFAFLMIYILRIISRRN